MTPSLCSRGNKLLGEVSAITEMLMPSDVISLTDSCRCCDFCSSVLVSNLEQITVCPHDESSAEQITFQLNELA